MFERWLCQDCSLLPVWTTYLDFILYSILQSPEVLLESVGVKHLVAVALLPVLAGFFLRSVVVRHRIVFVVGDVGGAVVSLKVDQITFTTIFLDQNFHSEDLNPSSTG